MPKWPGECCWAVKWSNFYGPKNSDSLQLYHRTRRFLETKAELWASDWEMEEEEHEVYGGEIPVEGEMDGDVDMSGADDDAVKVALPFCLSCLRESQKKQFLWFVSLCELWSCMCFRSLTRWKSAWRRWRRKQQLSEKCRPRLKRKWVPSKVVFLWLRIIVFDYKHLVMGF